MDAQDFRSLQEAYMEVVENQQQLDEAKGEGPEAATPGTQLYQQLFRGVKKEKGSKRTRQDTASVPGKGSRANRRMNNMEEVDIYNIILSHLLDEGYAETQESAERIMVNMSEEWREEIMLEYVSPSMFSVSGGGSRSGPSERERKKQERDQRGQELRSRLRRVVGDQRRGSHGEADAQMSAQPARKKDYDPNSGWAHYYDDSARGRATALRPRG